MAARPIFDNALIMAQADSLQQRFEKLGFGLVKYTSMAMQSQYEIPITLSLREGTWYRMVFIGDVTSRLYELRLFDWAEKQVVYQRKNWGDIDGNIIWFDYIPQFTEYHMLRTLQINKLHKNISGYAMIFKKIVPAIQQAAAH